MDGFMRLPAGQGKKQRDPPQKPMTPRDKMMLGAYGVFSWLAAPPLFAYMLARSTRDPGWRARLPERWGLRIPPLPPGAVWLHGASLGEARALAALAGELRRRRPDLPLLLTAFTPAGSSTIQASLAESQFHCFLPLDLGIANRRFLDAARPALGIILETEIWPGLYAACGAAGVPLAIASARLSRRSHRRYRRLRWLTSAALRQVRAVGAQSERDARRFRSIGPAGLDVRVTGNLKFHQRPASAPPARAAELRRRIGSARPAWIAASTHQPEEQVALRAHQRLLASRGDALLIIAPRHRERFAAARTLAEQSGLECAIRSRDRWPPPAAQVFLLDSLGEMNAFYAAANLAFVGGSIARVGGHNLLEPAAAGLPVLAGPHLFQTRETARLLDQAGALFVVRDAAQLAAQLARLLGDADARERAGRAARDCVAAGQGVLEQTLALIEPLLPPRTAKTVPSSG